MSDRINIFTDGAAKGNPGPGGYGIVIVTDDTVTELGGYKPVTTNNAMELTAVIKAIEAAPKEDKILAIYTDSKYVVEGSKAWIFGWIKNGWKTKTGSDVLNKELWQTLQPLLQQTHIEWHKVPGHVGIIGNERADEIASSFAVNKSIALYTGPKLEYKLQISDTSYDALKAQERSDARKRSAQKAYSYVSLVNGDVQTHQTWQECETRVRGVRGARFKKSLDNQNEQDIIKDFMDTT